MVHNPKHKVHSFRGLLGDGGEDEINLERQNLNLAYRIVKFQLQFSAPGVNSVEHVVNIYREEQTSITGLVDFSNPDLLASAYLADYSSVANSSVRNTVVFDNTLFSRNIYVTHSEVDGSTAVNYYIEIEEVPVNAATLMQIKLGTARTIKTKQSMGSG